MINPIQRRIKPAFFASPEVGKLSFPARLVFIALWTMADREGRLEHDIELIKHHSLPYDESSYFCSECHFSGQLDMNQLLDELVAQGMIRFYDKKRYIHIPGLPNHQTFFSNEKESQLPEPPPLTESPLDLFRRNDDSMLELRLKSELKLRLKCPVIEIIVGHLNKMTKKQFKPDSIDTIQKIDRLWAVGWRLDDFQYVHTIKSQDWLGGKFEKFLRPATLYQPAKFEAYRNQKVETKMSDRMRRNLASAAAYLRSQGIDISQMEAGSDANDRETRNALQDRRGSNSD